MEDLVSVIEDITQIYRKSASEAEKYLDKARKLGKVLGHGPAVVYCWFYSVPQKWTQVEPKIFEIMQHTKSFDLDVIFSMSLSNIASILRPMIFHNQISYQLKNFCSAIKTEFSSWGRLAEALRKEGIFEMFGRMKNYRNIRVTFKNLAAMKTFVGMDDDLLILDTHVAKVMGISRNELSKFRTQGLLFKNLLEVANEVTIKLRMKGFSDVSMIKWSLAVWFDGAKITADELLTKLK